MSVRVIHQSGHFGLTGSDASFTLGFSFLGEDQQRVLIPNDLFPVDLLLFRILGNVEVPNFVEAVLGAIQEPFANSDENYGLAWMGPFPKRGIAVRFTRPVKPAISLQIDLFS